MNSKKKIGTNCNHYIAELRVLISIFTYAHATMIIINNKFHLVVDHSFFFTSFCSVDNVFDYHLNKLPFFFKENKKLLL